MKRFISAVLLSAAVAMPTMAQKQQDIEQWLSIYSSTIHQCEDFTEHLLGCPTEGCPRGNRAIGFQQV